MRFILQLTLGVLLIGQIALAKDIKTTQEMSSFVNTNAQKVITVLERKSSDAEKKQALYNLFCDIVDYEWMGKFVIAKNWKTLNAEQQRRYMEAYKGYLSNLYTKRFVEYNNQEYEILDVNDIGRDHFAITTEISESDGNGKTFKVVYRVRKFAGTIKIIDIIGEGISLLNTQRSSFSSIMEKNDIALLIKELNKKAAL